MIPPLLRLAACLLVLTLLPSCAWWQRRGEAKRRVAWEKSVRAARERPHFVGRVTLVNSDARFALIDTPGTQQPREGTTLRAYANGAATAELRTTGVRRRSFLIADLVSGIPQRDDEVWQGPADSPAAIPRASAVERKAEQPVVPRRAWWQRWLPRFGRRE